MATQACQWLTQAAANLVQPGLHPQGTNSLPSCYYQNTSGSELLGFNVLSGSYYEANLSAAKADETATAAKLGRQAVTADEPALGPEAYSTTTSGPRSATYIGGITYSLTWNEGRHTFSLTYSGSTTLPKLLSAALVVYRSS